MKARPPSVLRFSPTAWAKLLYLRDAGDTEIGGFGISTHDDLLLIEDVQLVAQSCTWTHVAFDDEAVADFFDQQVEAGRQPQEFGRIWLHTHPGRSPEPSGTDEATFSRVFGNSDWAVMFIIARGGQTYARLRYNIGPGADVMLRVEVEYGGEFAGTNFDAWQADYLANVRLPPAELPIRGNIARGGAVPCPDGDFRDESWHDAWDDYVDFEHSGREGNCGFVRDF
jgi:proteasome lid subunit RPN8/RPN11